jgi:hypothetical protein
MGRVTYEEMAKFWPSSGHPIAAPMNETPKVVFSASLQSATWPPARIARGDTAEELARLKQEPGGEIIAHGGTKFARSQSRLGLVDEYRLWVLPAAVGTRRAAVHRAGPAGDPEPGQDHGVSVRHPRAVLRAGRPRGVTFKIPDRATQPARETGLERGAVPGLAPTG